MNLDSDPNLKPDRSTTIELEGGYKTSEKTYMTLNLFKTEIKDPIIYGVTPTSATNNFNGERTGTLGGELEFRLKDTWGYTTLAYSYYEADGSNDRAYTVADNNQLLLGFPGHKITLNSSFSTLIPNVKVSPSIIYMSEYYAYNWDTGAGARYQQKLNPDPLVNLFFWYENLGVKGFDLGAGVFNILDTDWKLAQPYESGTHAPMPTQSREIVMRMNYGLDF